MTMIVIREEDNRTRIRRIRRRRRHKYRNVVTFSLRASSLLRSNGNIFSLSCWIIGKLWFCIIIFLLIITMEINNNSGVIATTTTTTTTTTNDMIATTRNQNKTTTIFTNINKNEKQQIEQQRIVIFVGPHKSASSSIQEFFVQYASGRPKTRKLKAFQNWRWPIIQSTKYTERKIFARLILQSPTDTNDEILNLRNYIKSTITKKWNQERHMILTKKEQREQQQLQQQQQQQQQQQSITATAHNNNNNQRYNLVIASEEFDRYGNTKWSKRNGIKAIHDIISVLKPIPPKFIDLVVNYRTPRYEHWISIWKQLTLVHAKHLIHPEISGYKTNYKHYICYDERIWEYLNCVSNPLGLSYELSKQQSYISSNNNKQKQKKQNWNITIIDMGGITSKGLDIIHVSSCYILNVPCTDDGYWIKGINSTLSINKKTRELDFLNKQNIYDMEWLFRKRDCAYYYKLYNQSNINILFPHTIWNDCFHNSNNNNNNNNNDNQQLQEFYDTLLNTTFFLELLQSQFHCSVPTTTSNSTTTTTTTANTTKRNQFPSSSSTIKNLTEWIQSVSLKYNIPPISTSILNNEIDNNNNNVGNDGNNNDNNINHNNDNLPLSSLPIIKNDIKLKENLKTVITNENEEKNINIKMEEIKYEMNDNDDNNGKNQQQSVAQQQQQQQQQQQMKSSSTAGNSSSNMNNNNDANDDQYHLLVTQYVLLGIAWILFSIFFCRKRHKSKNNIILKP